MIDWEKGAKLALIGLGAYTILGAIKRRKIGVVEVTPVGDICRAPAGALQISIGGISDQEALLIANRLESAMYDIGTNEKTLFANVEKLSGPDLVRVYNAFGQRSYALWGNFFGLPAGFPLDLFGWFYEELGPKDLEKMRQIWIKSGLTWTV